MFVRGEALVSYRAREGEVVGELGPGFKWDTIGKEKYIMTYPHDICQHDISDDISHDISPYVIPVPG